LVLLIYFAGVAVPRYLVDLSSYWYLVIALALYNGSVIAEVFRAGILALGRGQREAALAIGFTEGQALRRVLFPQAVRSMVPAIINQLVTLLKDSSLGALVLVPAVDDLLRRGRQIGEFNRNPLQALLITGLVYIAVNFALSSFARRLESRQSRMQRARLELAWSQLQRNVP
jgi:glutamate transport system permease protein